MQDTISRTLYSEIHSILAQYGVNVGNLLGQGYDGASNMRGEWNGLQALFLNDFPQAYYVHCLAHRLQLTSVAASKELDVIHEFYHDISLIVIVVTSTSKRHDELQVAYSKYCVFD